MADDLKSKEKKKACPESENLWQAALYVRLSREDGDKEESDSVVNQRALLTEFVQFEDDITVYDIYIDDGWSGTNFERPEFRRMLNDIKNHTVNCVIVKDLSRFGRNYIDVGQYIEKIFPLMDVRFISVTDSLDSVKHPQTMNNIMVPFKNLINDEYCRDISNKVRSSLDIKRKQGKHIGSFACYGYLKDPADRNHLIPDPVAGEVVKDIFRWFLEGSSILGIAKKLNRLGIPNPTAYKQARGEHYHHPRASINDGLWPDSSVRRILRNRMYTGVMVQGVNKVKSYKVQVAQRQKEEDWIVVEDTHAPLISKETFELVQSMLSKRSRVTPGKQVVHLFSGFLKCADCGKAMNRKTVSQPYATYCYYVCSTFKKMSSEACTKHTIRSDKLEEAVLAAIRLQIALAVDMEAAIALINQSEVIHREAGRLRKLWEQAQKEVTDAENLILGLYPDWKSGMISKEEYQKLKARFELKKADAMARLDDLQVKIEAAEKGENEQNDFLRNFIRYRNIETLTREVLAALVDAIYIYEGGDLRIEFKFRDPFRAAADYIENNKDVLKPETKFSLFSAV